MHFVQWENDNYGEHVSIVELDGNDPFAVRCDDNTSQIFLANSHDQDFVNRLASSCPRCSEMLSFTKGRFGEEAVRDGHGWGVVEGPNLFRRGGYGYALVSGSLWDSPYYHVFWFAAPSLTELSYTNLTKQKGSFSQTGSRSIIERSPALTAARRQVAMIDESVSISELFREQLLEALDDQHVETSDMATGYLLSLLEELADPSKARMPDLMHHTLVELMVEAQQLQGGQQAQRWRIMGDAVLVATGIYRGKILKRGMDLNYYFLMGRSAYRRAAALHKVLGGTSLAELCNELGIKLPRLSDVFEQVMAAVSLHGDQGLVFLVERWQQDRATWVRKMLKRKGLKIPGGNH